MNAIIISALLGVVMMLCSVFVKNKSFLKHIAATGLLVLLISNVLETYGCSFFNINTHGMLSFDKFGLYANSLIVFSTLVYVILSGGDIENVGDHVAEYFVLMFFVLCGATVLTSYNNLLMLFIGIEILSIPLYILTGSDKQNLRSNEAALKYFLMGSFSTGIMLMGIALMYGGTGTFQNEVVRKAVEVQPGLRSYSFLEVTGLIFLFASMCFKVSAAPFHFWTPDVYDGAPSVFTSFMATIVKAAAFLAFIKLIDARAADTIGALNWKLLISIVIVATLFIGNITAVFQQSVKRMLAYSSIAQVGFMLFALFGMNGIAKEGLLLYVVAYSLATIGIFAILIKMKDYTFEGYNGLGKINPVLAFTNTVFLLSLAGIPLTAGFFAKYYMLASVVKTGSYLWLVVVGVIFAAISVYYYFRVIQAMYFKESTETEIVSEVSSGFKFALIVIAALIIMIGVFPQTVLNWYYF